MMNNLKEYNNFLPIEEFKKLQNLIFHLDFPWRIRQSMTDLDKNIYFTYSFLIIIKLILIFMKNT